MEPSPAAPARSDRSRSDRIVEAALAATSVYRESQKANVRLMADDLFERRSEWRSVPFRLLFEFNRLCNVKCVHCDIRRAGTEHLPIEVFERLLEEIGWGSIEVMPLAGGEPTLAPIHAAADVARRHNHWFNFITNGILFDRAYFEEIADVTARVQFSFHSHRRDVFASIMPGAEFDRVVRNLGDAVELSARTGAHVVPTIVAMRDNLDSMAEYVDFVADLGVNRVIIQKLYPHTKRFAELDANRGRSAAELDEIWSHVLETANRRRVFIETCVPHIFRRQEGVPFTRSRFDILQENAGIVGLYHPEFCISTALQTVIERDGTVLPCVRDRIVLGNILESSFMELWNGPVMQRLRRSLFDRCPSAHCAKCKEFWLGHP